MIKKITLFLGLTMCAIAPVANAISCDTSIEGVTPITFKEGEIAYDSATKTFTINRTISTRGRDSWDDATENDFISYTKDTLRWILGLFNNSTVKTNYREAQVLVINGGAPFNVTNPQDMYENTYNSIYEWYEAEVAEWKIIWKSTNADDKEEINEFKLFGCDTPEKAALLSIYETIRPVEVLS